MKNYANNYEYDSLEEFDKIEKIKTKANKQSNPKKQHKKTKSKHVQDVMEEYM